MRVTAEMLRDRRACSHQVEVFAAEWPEGCEITADVLARARELGLDLDWFGCTFLGVPFHAAVAEPRRVYRAALAEPLRVYHAALAEPLRVYHAALAEARRVFHAAVAEPLRVYHAALAEAILTCVAEQGGQDEPTTR